MNFWEVVGKNIKAIYWIVFILGVVLLFLSMFLKIFSLQSILKSFPIAAGLTAAYLWIRQDIWRDDETIKKLTNDQEIAQRNLISQRSDDRVVFVLLVIVAVAQASLLKPESYWIIFFGMLFTLAPLCNWFARSMERRQLSKFNKK